MKMLFARFVNSYCERRLSLTISGCTAVKILRLEMQRSTLTDWLGGPNVTERIRAILQILLREGDDELSRT